MTTKPGEVLTEARLNQDSTLLVGRVVFQAFRSSAQSIPNATVTAISWDSVDTDVLTGWAGGTPTRYTPNVAGKYVVSGHVGYSNSSSTSYRYVLAGKNGTAVAGSRGGFYSTWGTNVSNLAISTISIDCNGTTDYIEIMAHHGHGSAVNTATFTPDFYPNICITYGGAL